MPSSDYNRIACAITYLQHNVTAQPAAFAALRLSTTTMTSAGRLLREKNLAFGDLPPARRRGAVSRHCDGRAADENSAATAGVARQRHQLSTRGVACTAAHPEGHSNQLCRHRPRQRFTQGCTRRRHRHRRQPGGTAHSLSPRDTTKWCGGWLSMVHDTQAGYTGMGEVVTITASQTSPPNVSNP